jgi:hypothetical protein
MFGIIVAVVAQSIFHLEMHQDDIFFIFKKLFLISAYQNNPKTIKNIKFKQKKNSNILETWVGPRFQTGPESVVEVAF